MNIDSSTKQFIYKILGLTVILLIFTSVSGYISELVLQDKFSTTILNSITTFISVITALGTVRLSVWFIHKLKSENTENSNEDSVLTDHQAEITHRFIQITVYVGTALFILSYIWKINISNLLVGAGVLGVLVGFSARHALSSVMAGIIIMSTNMYKVKDWVKIGDKFGQVRKITFFNTHFKSPQGEKHIIPNNNITENNITNLTQGQYRNDLLVSIDYDTDIKEAISICDEELSTISKSDEENAIVGFHPTSVKEMDSSSIELSVKVWINPPTPSTINQTQTVIFDRIHTRFNEENITIPFPQRTISNRDE